MRWVTLHIRSFNSFAKAYLCTPQFEKSCPRAEEKRGDDRGEINEEDHWGEIMGGNHLLQTPPPHNYQTSRMRIIHAPCSFNRGSSLSRSTIFPQFSTRCLSVVYGGPGSAPSNRYGWLQHLRSCMRMFSSRILSDFPAPFTTSISFISIFVYLSQLKVV